MVFIRSLYPRSRRAQMGVGTTLAARRRAAFTSKVRAARAGKLSRSYRLPRSSSLNYRTGGFLGLELKFLDCAWNGVTINSSTDGSNGEVQPSSGCTSCISVPAQGDGETQRDGRKYTIKSCFVSGQVTYAALSDQADATTFPAVYLALVLDTQANASTIVSENVFVNPSTGANAMMPQPLRNLQNSKRFRILDSCFLTGPEVVTGTDGASTLSIAAEKSLNFKLSWQGNLNCDSVGTTANVSSASDNALHVIAYAESTTGTPVLRAKSRVRFMG